MFDITWETMKINYNSFKKRVPKVKHDPSLDKYDGVDLFPDKTAKANELLSRTGHPENYLKRSDAFPHPPICTFTYQNTISSTISGSLKLLYRNQFGITLKWTSPGHVSARSLPSGYAP